MQSRDLLKLSPLALAGTVGHVSLLEAQITPHPVTHSERIISWARLSTLPQAFVPPSTVRFAPVIYEDSGPATNDTNAATSSTRP